MTRIVFECFNISIHLARKRTLTIYKCKSMQRVINLINRETTSVPPDFQIDPLKFSVSFVKRWKVQRGFQIRWWWIVIKDILISWRIGKRDGMESWTNKYQKCKKRTWGQNKNPSFNDSLFLGSTFNAKKFDGGAFD